MATAEDADSGVRKPIQHRPPTDATYKQLYATAYRCGVPSCLKPLYRVNDDTGETLLNSLVAHIHARSENGPRWNAEMSEADNRDASNLIPLCEPHAREIDATPNHFTPETLRAWKAAQLAEYQRLQKGWLLSPQEVAEVRQASSDAYAYGVASASASAIVGAARAVGLLIDIARRMRRGPAKISAEWHRYRARLTASMPVFDGDGNRLAVEPAARDTRQFADAVVAELDAARLRLEPLASAVRGELQAVGAVNATLSRWIWWTDEAVSEVVVASSVWPAPGYEGDDDRLDAALEQLRRASAALSAAWRGDLAEQPPAPAPPAPEPVETPTQRALREHTEVLDSARPWARVNHRAYDPALYEALVETAAFALYIPRVPTALAIDLAATADLAADVARNADEATFSALLEQAATNRPLAVAVELLSALGAIAESSGRDAAASDAAAQITQLLTNADWADRAVWEDNAHHMQRLLGLTAAKVTDDNTISAAITAALDDDRELLFPILRAIVQSAVQLSRTGAPGVIKHGLDEVPSWLPVERVAAEIAEQLPDLQPADDEDHNPHPHIEHNLAAHLLRIAAHRPQKS
ncbi:hypothetical protein [Nocardia sp. CA-120079]|uniref:hypothetical protein n=1 Tax=Nocardia sp. CA-120079 TaxID=3239974 RepID=UPI003D983E7C